MLLSPTSSNNFHIASRNTNIISLSINLPSFPNLNSHLFRQSCNNRNPNTMQPARNCISLIIKLTTSMKLRNNNFHSRPLINWMHINRHSSPIVLDTHRTILINRNPNLFPRTSHMLINRIVNDFVNTMMQTILISRPNIHPRSFTHSLKSL